MNIRATSILLFSCLLATMFLYGESSAKTQRTQSGNSAFTNSETGPETVRNLEERLTPYLRHRIARRHKQTQLKRAAPRETDLLLLAKVWSALSTEFKKLYLESVTLSGHLTSYTSPGGHFEILYSLTGRDSIDATDHYGFSDNNWRNKTSNKNGIPDYIDETAYALDSSWAMIIDRFGFLPPHVYQDSLYPSEKYKVVIEEQDAGYYGITWLYEQVTNGKNYYTSYISLRNNWSSPEWYESGYNINPVNGIRVTCAHEFFHTIQYSMSTKIVNAVWLDNFPLSWTEGSAASMEELAFDSIDDYHQYAETYFKNPAISFFDNSTSDVVYTNAILFLYIYQHWSDDNRITFLRSMLFASNEDASLPFYQNLLNAAARNNGSWPTRLHDFHCASLYTGTSARQSLFLSDAELFRGIHLAPLSTIDTVRTVLPPNSGYFIRLIRDARHSDTLSVSITAALNQSSKPKNSTLPSSSLLLKNRETDTLLVLNSTSTGGAGITLTNWHTWDTLTLITTNGNPVERPEVKLFIQPYPVYYRKKNTVADTVADIPTSSSAILTIRAINDLHADYAFNVTDAPVGSSDDDQLFSALSAPFEVAIPAFWHENAAISLTVHSSTLPPAGDSLWLGIWDARSMSWKPVASRPTTNSDTSGITGSITGSGVYALLKRGDNTPYISQQLVIFPNPLSIRHHQDAFNFRGEDITRIAIHRLDGVLLHSFTNNTYAITGSQTFQWNIRQTAPACSPGLYVAIVEQNDTAKKAKKITRHKLMITP